MAHLLVEEPSPWATPPTEYYSAARVLQAPPPNSMRSPVAEAIRRLSVNVSTVETTIDDKRLPCIRLLGRKGARGRVLVRTADVDALLRDPPVVCATGPQTRVYTDETGCRYSCSVIPNDTVELAPGLNRKLGFAPGTDTLVVEGRLLHLIRRRQQKHDLPPLDGHTKRGAITAVTIDDPAQFHRSRHVSAHMGPRTLSNAEKVRLRRDG
jgi:hypothetical protein